MVAKAHEAASGIRKWALSKNLMPALPADAEAEYVANVPEAQFSEKGEIILRNRGISSIAFNDAEGTVFVYTKRRLTQKDAAVLPEEVFGCVVHYPHGEIDSLGQPPQQTQGAPYSIVTVASTNFYTCGSSISPGNSASAGTLGALVKDANGVMYGLTNNHVTGGCSHSAIGLPIGAPGVMDVAAGGIYPFTIGLHAGVLSMIPGDGGNVDIQDNTDAAIFKIVSPGAVSSFQGCVYDTPTVSIDPHDGMLVQKVGRTTGHTTGRIVGRELLPVRVLASAPNYGFQALILFPEVYVVHGDNSPFSEGGDSGSLVVTEQNDGSLAAVGLLFAGGQDSRAPGNLRTFILPITPILDRLKLTLIGGHNVP